MKCRGGSAVRRGWGVGALSRGCGPAARSLGVGCSPSPALARPSLLPEPLAAGVRAPASMALHDTRAFFLNELSPLGFIIRRINHEARVTRARAPGEGRRAAWATMGTPGWSPRPPKVPRGGGKGAWHHFCSLAARGTPWGL